MQSVATEAPAVVKAVVGPTDAVRPDSRLLVWRPGGSMGGGPSPGGGGAGPMYCLM